MFREGKPMTKLPSLSEECETLLDQEHIRIFEGPDGVTRALFHIDEDKNPLPGGDPNDHGWALMMVNFINGNDGFAICEVVHINSLLSELPSLGVEVVESL